MNRNLILLAFSFFVMSCASVEYERKLESSENILDHGESIIYPTFKKEGMELTRVIEVLSERTMAYSQNGIGLSIILILNPNETNPLISLDTEGKNFFELLDLICIEAGPEYFWSATDAVVVQRKTSEGSNPIDPFETQKPNQSEVATP